MRKIQGRRSLPSAMRTIAPVPKSTCASSAASVSIRRNGNGFSAAVARRTAARCNSSARRRGGLAPSPGESAPPPNPARSWPRSLPERLRMCWAARWAAGLASRWARLAGFWDSTPADPSPASFPAAHPFGSSSPFPVGAFGWIWALARARCLPDRLPVHPQKGGDFAVRVSGFMKCKDRVDFGHRESFRHLRSPSAKEC